MAIANILGKGSRYNGNCKAVRLSTTWKSYNPAEWPVGGLDIFGVKWSGLYKLYNIEERLWLADTNGFATHFASSPRTNYTLNGSHGVFYNNKPKSIVVRYLPPEIEFNKNGEPYPVSNKYFTPYLKYSQRDTVATFRIGGGPVIATTDFAAFWGSKHEISFISSGRYDCDWVLIEDGEEFDPPEISGNPTPNPEPRTPNNNPPPDGLKKERTKPIDLTTIFIYYQNQQYRNSYTDYGVHSSYLYTGIKPFTIQTSKIPINLFQSHGITFFTDSDIKKKHFIYLINLDETVKTKPVTKIDVKAIAFLKTIMQSQSLEEKTEAINTVESRQATTLKIPESSKIWSYSYFPSPTI